MAEGGEILIGPLATSSSLSTIHDIIAKLTYPVVLLFYYWMAVKNSSINRLIYRSSLLDCGSGMLN